MKAEWVNKIVTIGKRITMTGRRMARPNMKHIKTSTSDLPIPHLTYSTAWIWVLCVIGLDYISSLAYVPSVAYSVAGPIAPLVIGVVVVVTLFLAVPLFCYTAGRSPHGHGSLGLLERVLPGWRGKFCVVVMLGFIATDLVFTRTFSAADAAEHLIHSPYHPWQHTLDEAALVTDSAKEQLPTEIASLAGPSNTKQLIITIGLIVVGSAFGWLFRKGFDRRIVRIAVVAVGVYILLTAYLVGSGLAYFFDHPELVERWWDGVRAGTWKTTPPEGGMTWPMLILAAVLLFPHVALGLSGYELTLAAMPLVRGKPDDDLIRPRGRINRTRWMLVVSALLMSILLLASTFVTTILIPGDALKTDGRAANRALAYFAHGGPLVDGVDAHSICRTIGPTFGAIYDASTVVVLTLAGLTVLIGTRELIPPYLHRLGMEWTWSRRLGLLMYALTAIKIGVTYFYRADVDAQRGVYLTGVLALFTGASLTAMADVWMRRKAVGWKRPFRISPLFLLASIVFAASLIVVAVRHPAAVRMAGIFVVILLGTSMVTRFFRTRELRFEGFDFESPQSRELFEDLTHHHFPMLVPMQPGGYTLAEKEFAIRTDHRLPEHLPVVFILAELGDPSDFAHRPLISVEKEGDHVVVEITRCTSIPHAIAACALEIAKEGPVPELHFAWSSQNPFTANLNFVLFGQGNVPWMVHELIRTAKIPANRKPRVMIG
jgi:hypothetical protein